MTDKKDKSHPNWIMAAFGKIIDESHAKKMARSGGVAGFFLSGSEALGAVLTYYGFDPTTGEPVAKMDMASLEFMLSAGASGLLVLLLIWMSWRTHIGKALVSPILLLALLIYEGYTKLLGGTLGGAWTVVYLLFAITFIGAVRAAWYLKKAKKSPNLVNEF